MPVAVDDVPLDIIFVSVENLSTDKRHSCHLELRVCSFNALEAL